MNLTTTAAGGFELELEHPTEWLVVLAILHDAHTADFDLAASVGARMADTGGWEDWSEWVLPDIRDGFEQHLQTVTKAIEAGRGGKFLEPGVVAIPKDAFFDWYSALNQARLALEAKYHFGPKSLVETGDNPTERRAAYYRSQFYSFLQSNLLDKGLG